MNDEVMVLASRTDIDNVVFSAAQEYAETTPLSMRERMKLTLEISDRIMQGIDSITEAGKRSERGRQAAQARHAKPKPGPAIPVPPLPVAAPTNAQLTQAALAAQQSLPLPPPPHPALMPQGHSTQPAAGAMPFGPPPA